MAIRRSVGCSCCGPTTAPTGCNRTIELKPYPTRVGRYSHDNSNPDHHWGFDRTVHTDWASPDPPAEGEDAEPDWWSGDIPENVADNPNATPNVIPANSTIDFEIKICCLEYMFELEFIHIDPNDDETIIRCGPMRFKVHEDINWSVQSAMEWCDSRVWQNPNWSYDPDSSDQYGDFDGEVDGRTSIQFYSLLDSDGFHNMASASTRSHYRDPIDGDTDLYQACGSFSKFSDEVTSEGGEQVRTVRLTIQTGAYPVEIGGILFKQGAEYFTPYYADATKDFPYGSGGIWDHMQKLNVRQSYRVFTERTAVVSGYGTTNVKFENKGVLHASPNCYLHVNDQENYADDPHYETECLTDYGSLNGTWNGVLVHNDYWPDDKKGCPVDPSVFQDISDLQSLLSDWSFGHDSNIMEYWMYQYDHPYTEIFAPATGTPYIENTDSSEYYIGNSPADDDILDIYRFCPDRPQSDSVVSSCSFTRLYSGVKTKHNDGSGDAKALDYNSDPSYYRHYGYAPEFLMDTNFLPCVGCNSETDPDPHVGEGWNPAKPILTWDHSYTPGFNPWVSCVDLPGNNLHIVHPGTLGAWDGDLVGFKLLDHWTSSDANETINASSEYLLNGLLVETGIELSNDTGTEVQVDYPTWSVTQQTFTYRDEGNTGPNPSDSRMWPNRDWYQELTVTGGWSASIQRYDKYTSYSQLRDEEHVDNGNLLLYPGVVYDFKVTKTTYSGDPLTAGTPEVFTQVGESVLPQLVEGPVVTESYDPWTFELIETPSYRPSGTYDDGKLYFYCDDQSVEAVRTTGHQYDNINLADVNDSNNWMPSFMKVITDDEREWHIHFPVTAITNDYLYKEEYPATGRHNIFTGINVRDITNNVKYRSDPAPGYVTHDGAYSTNPQYTNLTLTNGEGCDHIEISYFHGVTDAAGDYYEFEWKMKGNEYAL